MTNKKSIYAIVLTFIIIGAFAYVLTTNNGSESKVASSTSSAPPSSPAAQESSPNIKQASPAANTPSYQDYSVDKLATVSNQRVLFFHAPWCFQCRELDKELSEQGAPTGYTVFKVDYDSNEALRQKYGITFRTAFLKVDANGDAIGKEYIAYDEPSLNAVKRDFLTQ